MIKNKENPRKFNCTTLHNHQMSQQTLHGPTLPSSFFQSQSKTRFHGQTPKSVLEVYVWDFHVWDFHNIHVHLKKYFCFTCLKVILSSS